MIKVIHLLNHLEKIERDLTEIEELKSRLEQDRTYTSRVRKSLEEETLRLRELRGTIGRLIVREAPPEVWEDFQHFLARTSQPKARPVSQKAAAEPVLASPKVDIILPNKALASQTSSLEKDSVGNLSSNPKSSGKNPETPKKMQKPRKQPKAPPKMQPGEKEDPPFRWKFVQN